MQQAVEKNQDLGNTAASTSAIGYDPLAQGAKRPDWKALLDEVLEKPGVLSDAYKQFPRYSAGNACLLVLQATFRGIPLGPVASFNGWKKLGYQVKKGESAFSMVMPVMVSKKSETDEGDTETKAAKKPQTKTGRTASNPASSGSDEDAQSGGKRQIFMFRKNWFLFSQVEPTESAQPLPPTETPEWSMPQAARALGIAILPFESTEGNCQGYATKEGISINPMARFPMKTAVHEMAHVLLGHIDSFFGGQPIEDGETLTTSRAEAEAESVAYIVGASLGFSEEDLSSARAYVQRWLCGKTEETAEFLKKSPAKIFAVADKILRAGKPVQENPDSEGSE